MANWVDMLRCAHTADVHLGRAFGYLGEAAPGHQERLKRAFRRVFAEAQANECALVLIAGDLFDSPSVGREWVAFALATIADARLPTVVIPGNHDPAERHPFRDTALPSNLHFLAETGRLRLSALDVEIVACPAGDTARWEAALRRDPNGAPLQIALMHGSMPAAGVQSTIQPAWISASGLDYVALGDWHSPHEWTQGQTVCWYSGAPEMILPRQQLPATMCLVELQSGQPARVSLLPTGEARYPNGAPDGVLNWDVSPYRDAQDLLHDLQATLTPETVATIRLVGRWDADEPLDIALLAEQLQPYCLWLEIQPAYQVGELTPRTPFEELLTQLAQEYESRTPQDAALYREAAQLSLYLLRGGRL
jgi:predicted phosphodiesterase